MAQTIGTGLKFSALDAFLDQLHSRWSREACSKLCSLESESNDSAARAIFDNELVTLHEISRVVERTFRTLSANVKSQRNRFCKINNLPAEILREIFLSTCENGLRWWDLASILETCKTWYQILANDPSAYSAMSLGNNGCSRRRAEFFAERSVPLPLSVAWVEPSMDARISDSVWKGDFCTQYLARIKTLEYAQLDAWGDNWLRELPAPQLERCELSCPLFEIYYVEAEEDVEENQIGMPLSPDVLPSLFGGKAPKLHVLGLHEVRLAWRPGNYNDLTHLTLTAHPRVVAQRRIDSNDITIIFRDSPRLEHVELIASGDEAWWTQMDENAPSPDVTQRRHFMGHLRTLRLHLFASYVISILRAIEITPTITTVDLRCGNAGDVYGRCIEILDTDALPDFIFAKLQSLSFGWQGFRRGVSGSGLLADHEHSFICTPLNSPVELSWKIGFVQRLLELKHLKLPVESIRCLMRFLVASPALDEVVSSMQRRLFEGCCSTLGTTSTSPGYHVGPSPAMVPVILPCSSFEGTHAHSWNFFNSFRLGRGPSLSTVPYSSGFTWPVNSL